MPAEVEAYLRSLNTSDRARAAAWDAVYSVKDDTEAQRLLASLPFNDDTKATLWDARKGMAPEVAPPATPQAPVARPSAGSRYLGNLWEQINPVAAVKGIAQAVTSPIDTAKGLYQAHAEQFSKASDAASQGGIGNYSRAAGHVLAGVLPVIGPVAAQAGEQIGSGDIAGGFGTATGVMAPFSIKPVLQGARAAVPARSREAAAAGLEAGAAERVADVMSPKVGRNKIRIGNQAETVAPKMAKDLATDGAPLTREGFQAQVQTRLAAAERGLDEASDARLNGRAFETKPILDALLEKRRALTAEAVDASKPARRTTERTSAIVDEHGKPITVTEQMREAVGRDVVPHHSDPRVAEIDKAIAEIKQLGSIARYEDIRTIRMAYDPAAKVKYAPSVTEDFLAKSGQSSGAADVTSVLREHLAKWDPQTAAANADYHIYRTADDALEAVRQVERSRPRVGRQIMARLTGVLFGGQQGGVPGAVAGYVAAPLVDQMLSSGMTTKLKTARLMQNLADAIRAGDMQRVNGVVTLLQKEMRAAQASGLAAPTDTPLDTPQPSGAP